MGQAANLTNSESMLVRCQGMWYLTIRVCKVFALYKVQSTFSMQNYTNQIFAKLCKFRKARKGSQSEHAGQLLFLHYAVQALKHCPCI